MYFFCYSAWIIMIISKSLFSWCGADAVAGHMCISSYCLVIPGMLLTQWRLDMHFLLKMSRVSDAVVLRYVFLMSFLAWC